MGRKRGSAATRRARTSSYVGLWRAVAAAGLATLAFAPTALAQSSGGAPAEAVDNLVVGNGLPEHRRKGILDQLTAISSQ